MIIFKRLFFALFISFATIFLFVFLIRLSNNKPGFLGMNDLLSYFEKIDFYKPLDKFTKTFNQLKVSVQNFVDSVNINNVFGSSGGGRGTGNSDSSFWSNLGSSIGSVFSWLGNNVINFFKMLYTILAMPIMLVFDIVSLFIEYFKIFADFIHYIITFEGYIPNSLITT